MASMTEEQSMAVTQLRYEYGAESVLAIELTSEPRGVVKIEWDPNIDVWSVRRTLFVNPDGSRLSWRTLDS